MEKVKTINGRVMYGRKGLPGRKTTPLTSAYECECELCEYAYNSRGSRVTDLDEDERSPKVIYCEFGNCPFKDFYDGKKGQWKRKIVSVDNELKRMLGKEKSNEED